MGAAAAVLTFRFDASFHLGDFVVRWQTVGIAAAVFAGIAWWALIAGRTPAFEAAVGEPASEADPDAPEGAAGSGDIGHMRRDDLLFIILGALPGAVILGRLGYGLLHADWYARDWRQLLDPAGGSLELTGAVVGGTLTGIYVAALLDASVGRWLHVAIRPLLLALAVGKAAEVLGGGGQGALVLDGSGLATVYAGTGPWGSPGAEMPAMPAQLLEAAMAAVVLVMIALLGWRSGLRRADGRLFAVGLAAWALGRAVVAFTWRDAAVLGPLNAEQLICLTVAAVAAGSALVATLVIRRRRVRGDRARASQPDGGAVPERGPVPPG
jgi:prolipoprotein diacylglyceryltransferase